MLSAGVLKYSEVGAFDVYGDDPHMPLYAARHFTERELVELLRLSSFDITGFRYRRVRTRSGNRIYGIFFIARSR